MPAIDKNYRLFGVINLIDLVVIIALVVGGYAVYKVLAHKNVAAPGANTKAVQFTLFIPGVRTFDPSQVRVGDPISLKADGKTFGTVVSVEASASPIETYDTVEHKYVRLPSTAASDVYIKAETRGTPSGTGVAVGNNTLRNQELLSIITPTFEYGTAIVTDLRVQGQ